MRTHLRLLQAGDTALGFDLARTVVPDAFASDIAKAFGKREPRVVLIRRKRERHNRRSGKALKLRRFGMNSLRRMTARGPARGRPRQEEEDGAGHFDIMVREGRCGSFREQVEDDEELQRLTWPTGGAQGRGEG